MAPRWAAPCRPPVHDLAALSVAHARGSAAVYPRLPEDVSSPSGAGAAVRAGPEHSASVDSCPLGGPPGDAAPARGCSHPLRAGVGAAPRGGRGRRGGHGRADGSLPPCGHDGTERRLERPQDPLEQTRGDRGKTRCHTVKTVRLINAVLTILLLNETSAGSTHDQRMADAPLSPCPRGANCSRIWAS